MYSTMKEAKFSHEFAKKGEARIKNEKETEEEKRHKTFGPPIHSRFLDMNNKKRWRRRERERKLWCLEWFLNCDRLPVLPRPRPHFLVLPFLFDPHSLALFSWFFSTKRFKHSDEGDNGISEMCKIFKTHFPNKEKHLHLFLSQLSNSLH